MSAAERTGRCPFKRHHAAFLEALRVRHYSPSTIDSYGRALQSFWRFVAAHGLDQVQDVTAVTVRAYQLDLEARGLKPWSRCAYTQALRRFFEHLEKTDVILVNPCAGLLLPKIEDRLPKQLTQSQAHRLVNAPDVDTAKGQRDRAILELFYATGIRLAEMAALTLHDVDCRSGLLRVEKGKGGKGRVVPMGRKAVESLQRYLLKVRPAWVRSAPALKVERALWLSSIEPHRPIKAQVIQRMVREYGQEVGVQVTPHLWRHTCATHLVNNGANIAYVQRLLGHASLETTQIYTRVTLNEVKAAYHKAHPRSRRQPQV